MGKCSDAHEFAILYQEIYQDLYRFALYALGHAQDAEDAVGEAVADAYASFSRLRRRESFRPWIFRILSAKCKRKLKEYLHKTDELPENLSADCTLEEDLQVRQAFARLSGEERLILALHLFGGYSSSETGRILHLNPNTVRSKESRALEKMRGWLSDDQEVSI